MRDALRQAHILHQSGELDQAERICRQILAAEPEQAVALHLLGLLMWQAGRLDEAKALISRSLKQAPGSAEAHYNLGNILQTQGRWAEAEAHYRLCLVLKPDFTSALNNLGLVLSDLGRVVEAERLCRRALSLNPHSPAIRNNLGKALLLLGRSEESVHSCRHAVAIAPDTAQVYCTLGGAQHQLEDIPQAIANYRRALRIDPDLAMAHCNLSTALDDLGQTAEGEVHCRKALRLSPRLALAHSNLSNILQKLDRVDEAEMCCRDALAIIPDFPEAHGNLANILRHLGRLDEAMATSHRAITLNPAMAGGYNTLGNILTDLGRLDEAETAYGRALAIKPGYAEGYNNLASTLRELGRLDEAEAKCRRALAIKPGLAEIPCNLGNILKEQGRLDEAAASYRHAVEIKPDFHMARNNHAFALFALGDIRSAWTEYEARWLYKKDASLYRRRPFTQPWWQGEPLGGKEILIWSEQGLGDELIGVGMLPDMAARGGQILLECDPRLVGLFARSFPTIQVIARQDPPPPRTARPQVQTPMLGLGKYLRATLADFPRHAGFLVPDAAKAEHWARWLETLGPGRKVGISWRGRLIKLDRSRHYVPLKRLGPILDSPGLVFVNLQYDGHTEEIEALRNETGRVIHSPPGLDLTNDQDGVAALMAGLDAVTGPATAVGILAGALGRPTWMYALFPSANEKEVLGCDHVPWCPSIRVIPHGLGDDWEQTISRTARSLQTWSKGAP